MRFNYQNDFAWKNETMQTDKDKFGDYGCLISVIANIYQIVSKTDYTPLEMLSVIKKNNLFFTDETGTTSLLKTDDLFKLLGLKRKTINNFDYDNDDGKYYYAKVKLGQYNHYINVIDNQNTLFICYDVWDNKLKLNKNDAILQLYLVERI